MNDQLDDPKRKNDSSPGTSWLIDQWSPELANELEAFWEDRLPSKSVAIVTMLSAIAGQRSALTPQEFEIAIKNYSEILRHFHRIMRDLRGVSNAPN